MPTGRSQTARSHIDYTSLHLLADLTENLAQTLLNNTNHFCQSSHIKAGALAWERVSGDDLLRQAQLPPQRSHFVFMEILQRFDYFPLQDHRETRSAAVGDGCGRDV